MWFLRGLRRRRLLRRRGLPEAAWRSAWEALPLLHRLNAAEERRLRDLTLLFLHEKSIEPTGGLILDEVDRITVAAQACLPILNLGLDWYDGWYSFIVYPAEFVPHWEWSDETGVVHMDNLSRTGEAWLRGPVILSWEDVESGENGYNVVIHELAHKLDALDGDVNGLPPLHPEMQVREWSRAFTEAFEELSRRVDGGQASAIDAYAAEAPEEFFAVVSEYFFTAPGVLQQSFPAVYRQLVAFYRQDPLQTSA